MKLWAGRFQKDIDQKTNDFNSSISFDCRMAREDIAGSLAHAAMLQNRGSSPLRMGRRSGRAWPGSRPISPRAVSPSTRTPRISTPLWKGN